MSSTNNPSKKRKSGEDVDVSATEKKTYQELETELLNTQRDLLKTQRELLDTQREVVDTQRELVNTQKKLLAIEERPEVADERTDNRAEANAGFATVGGDSSDLSDGEDSVELDTKDTWNARFLELRAYRIQNGNCAVPRNGPLSTLGQWVNNQRRAYGNVRNGKKGLKITQERINMLDSLQFNWGKTYPAPLSWDDQFEELKKYQKAMGNCNVNISSTKPSPLAKWVSYQRSEYRRFKKGQDTLLTLDQITQLKEIGFQFKGPRLS